MLVPSHDLSQKAPDTIAGHRVSQATGSNKADARQAGILDNRRAKHQQFAASDQTISFYALVI